MQLKKLRSFYPIFTLTQYFPSIAHHFKTKLKPWNLRPHKRIAFKWVNITLNKILNTIDFKSNH